MSFEDNNGFEIIVIVRSKGTNRTVKCTESNSFRDNIPHIAATLGVDIRGAFKLAKDDGYMFSEHNKGKWFNDETNIR